MTSAYVLINTEIGKEAEIIKSLGSIGCAEETYMCYGLYSIVAKFKTNTPEELRGIISRYMLRKNGILNVQLCVIR